MKAIQEMNGKVMSGKPIQVSVFMNRHQRKHLLENQFNNKSMMGGMGGGAPFPGMQNQMQMRTQMAPQMMMMGPGRGGFGGQQKPMMNKQNMMHQGQQAQYQQQQMMMMQQGMMGPGGPHGMGHQGRGGMMGQQGQPQHQGNMGGQNRGGGNAGGQNQRPRGGGVGGQQQMVPTKGARNIGQGQGMEQQQGMPQQQIPQQQTAQQQSAQQQGGQQSNGTSQNPNFNREFYTSLDGKEKKQYLGEIIYPFVYAREPTTAAKITGMLLEIDDEELINYSKNTDNLIRKIEEAANVLKRYNQTANTGGGKPMPQGGKPGLNK